jgi:hypothetical protein
VTTASGFLLEAPDAVASAKVAGDFFAGDFFAGDFFAVGFFDALFLTGDFAVVEGLSEVTSESVPAFMAPAAPDVMSEGVVRLSGRFPEDSPPPRRDFFAGIPRV